MSLKRGMMMSIEPIEGSQVELACDICGYTVTSFDSFQEAVDYKKEDGWKSQKHKGEWEDICPECQEE